MSWYVYIVECSDGTLYTGTAVDVQKRIDKHNSGKGAKYTRARLPVKLKYSAKFDNRSLACKEECRVKKLGRIEKLQLINNHDLIIRIYTPPDEFNNRINS